MVLPGPLWRWPDFVFGQGLSRLLGLTHKPRRGTREPTESSELGSPLGHESVSSCDSPTYNFQGPHLLLRKNLKSRAVSTEPSQMTRILDFLAGNRTYPTREGQGGSTKEGVGKEKEASKGWRSVPHVSGGRRFYHPLAWNSNSIASRTKLYKGYRTKDILVEEDFTEGGFGESVLKKWQLWAGRERQGGLEEEQAHQHSMNSDPCGANQPVLESYLHFTTVSAVDCRQKFLSCGFFCDSPLWMTKARYFINT